MGRPGFPRRARLGAILAAALLLPAGAVRGDAEETEVRLKEAGVPPPLRARVHRAIDRAVAHFEGIQAPDGSFTTRESVGWHDRQFVPGITALVALACRHAGTPRGREVAARSTAWLFPAPGMARAEVYEDVYTAGIALMLLQVTRGDSAVLRDLAALLAESQSVENGWWGYATPKSSPGLFGNRDPGGFQAAARAGNLSTTQFAALGLRAAGLAGAGVPAGVWERHLLSLVGTQDSSGSWGYGPVRPGAAAATEDDYPQGTFMGFANLVLAEAAVRDRDGADPRYLQAGARALERGREALVRDGLRHLRDLRRGIPNDREGFAYYSLYALEKACVFAGIERLGEVPWYAAGAEVLVDTQKADGGWGSRSRPGKESRWEPASAPVTSAFALLFLVRSSEVYRTVSPRWPDRDRSVASGGGSDPGDPAPHVAAPAPDPVPLPVVIPLADAADALDLLEAQLRDPGVAGDALLRSLEFVRQAYAGFAGGAPGEDPAAVEAWRPRAEKVLLGAVVPGPRGKEALPARIRAAEVLAGCDPRVLPHLRRSLEAGPLRSKEAAEAGPLLEAALRTIASRGGEAELRWMMEEVVRPDDTPPARARARGGLRAIPAFGGLPGTIRREACGDLALRFLAREAAAAPVAGLVPKPPVAAVDYWREMEDPVMEALRALARDPATGKAPTLPSGAWAGTVARFLEWLDDHENVEEAPWKGRE